MWNAQSWVHRSAEWLGRGRLTAAAAWTAAPGVQNVTFCMLVPAVAVCCCLLMDLSLLPLTACWSMPVHLDVCRLDESMLMSRCGTCNAADYHRISHQEAAAHVSNSKLLELVDEFWQCGK